MRRAYSERTRHTLLTLPTVQVHLSASPWSIGLDADGIECGPTWTPTKPLEIENLNRKLMERDWRSLRERLIAFDDAHPEDTARWLADAGYLPTLSGSLIKNRKAWDASVVTASIADWLWRRARVVAWLMSHDTEHFRKLVVAAMNYQDESGEVLAARIVAANEGWRTPRLLASEKAFIKATHAPPDIDASLLAEFLTGAGRGLGVQAFFRWDREGTPSVTVPAATPMQAIGLSVHIDRNFSARQWTACTKCGKPFEKTRITDRFCPSPSPCKNNYTTARRRMKLRLLSEAETVWKAASPEKRLNQDHWIWIADWANRKGKGDFKVSADWAKHEFSKRNAHKGR